MIKQDLSIIQGEKNHFILSKNDLKFRGKKSLSKVYAGVK